MRAGLPWLLVLGAACGPADDDRAPGSLLDTGWFDTDDPLGCGGEVVGSAPAAGSSGWVVHDPLTVQVADARGLTDTTLRVLDDVGAEVPVEVVVDEASLGLVATPARALRPSTEHQLVVDSCAGTTVLTFTTSAFGAPLLGGPSSLVGKTFTLDLAGATWVEPAGLAALFRANVRDPILVGVQFADAVAIDLIGTQGLADGGRISQDLDAATWSLPQADFSQAPRMRSTATRVALDVQDVPLPVEDFELEITFSEDGERLGDGLLRGRMDTRDAAGLVGLSSGGPAAVCNLAGQAGLDCIPCADGQPYCIAADLRDLGGERVPGRLVPVASE